MLCRQVFSSLCAIFDEKNHLPNNTGMILVWEVGWKGLYKWDNGGMDFGITN